MEKKTAKCTFRTGTAVRVSGGATEREDAILVRYKDMEYYGSGSILIFGFYPNRKSYDPLCTKEGICKGLNARLMWFYITEESSDTDTDSDPADVATFIPEPNGIYRRSQWTYEVPEQ